MITGLNQYLKQRIKCLAQGNNAVPPVGLEPMTPKGLCLKSSTLPLNHYASAKAGGKPIVELLHWL